MTPVLLALLRLVVTALAVWVMGTLLARLWEAIEGHIRAESYTREPPLEPCTRHWSPSVALHMARWIATDQSIAIGCLQLSPLTATCKANGSGSPTD